MRLETYKTLDFFLKWRDTAVAAIVKVQSSTYISFLILFSSARVCVRTCWVFAPAFHIARLDYRRRYENFLFD